MMAQIITCPSVETPAHDIKIFLAGSIEMNKAENWQKFIESFLEKHNVTIFNPRRLNWNNEWKQTLEEPAFVEQVEWELRNLESCDYIFMHFDPNTISPITLLEYGMYAKSSPEKMIVSCPDGYYRKGNVQVTGRFYGVTIHPNILASASELVQRINEKNKAH